VISLAKIGASRLFASYLKVDRVCEILYKISTPHHQELLRKYDCIRGNLRFALLKLDGEVEVSDVVSQLLDQIGKIMEDDKIVL
jgi:hypothetical protein